MTATAPPPGLATTTLELYDAMGAQTRGDADGGYVLARWIDGAGQLLQRIQDLAGETADRPGWASVLDPDRCPPTALPWLGQFVGVRVDTGRTIADQRLQVHAEQGFARGTLAAYTAAIAATLAPGARIDITERAGGNAYTLRVRVYAAQCPDQARTYAAAFTEKPGGLVLDYAVVAGETYTMTRAALPADSYTARRQRFPIYSDATTYTG